jgi:hypothetical protein
MLRTALMISGLCSHFFNRPTLVLGFNQLFHNKKCILLERAAAAGSVCLCGSGVKSSVLGGY